MAKTFIIKEEGKEDIVFENVETYALVAQSLTDSKRDHLVFCGSFPYLIGQTHFLYQTILAEWRKTNG
jgi:hypothetical protein